MTDLMVLVDFAVFVLELFAVVFGALLVLWAIGKWEGRRE